MNLLVSSALFLAGMEYLYANMSPMPYVVVAIGALVLTQPGVQRTFGRVHRARRLVALAGLAALAMATAVVLATYDAPVYLREIAYAIMVLVGMLFFEKVNRSV